MHLHFQSILKRCFIRLQAHAPKSAIIRHGRVKYIYICRLHCWLLISWVQIQDIRYSSSFMVFINMITCHRFWNSHLGRTIDEMTGWGGGVGGGGGGNMYDDAWITMHSLVVSPLCICGWIKMVRLSTETRDNLCLNHQTTRMICNIPNTFWTINCLYVQHKFTKAYKHG